MPLNLLPLQRFYCCSVGHQPLVSAASLQWCCPLVAECWSDLAESGLQGVCGQLGWRDVGSKPRMVRYVS